MFQIIGLIITIGVIVWLAVQKNERTAAQSIMARPIKEQFASVGSASIYLIAMCGLILALTGLIPFLIFGAPMSGFVLLVHVAISPIFLLCVVAATLIWANSHRFDADNLVSAKACITRNKAMPANGGYDLWKKIFFWVIVLAVIMLSSIVLSMYPLFDTVGMKFFLDLHKFAALLFLVAGAGYVYTSMHSQVADEPEKA